MGASQRQRRGQEFPRATVRTNDADGEYTLEYRTSRARTAAAQGPTGQSEEGEFSNRATSPQQLSQAALRNRRLNMLGVPTMASSGENRRAASTSQAHHTSHRPSGPGSPSVERVNTFNGHNQRAASSFHRSNAMQPPAHQPSAANQTTVIPHDAAFWSVLGATGHSENGDDQPARRRTAREHYYNLNPSPRPSRVRRALRRVVTGISFRIGERIGRRISERIVGQTQERTGENVEGSRRVASRNQTTATPQRRNSRRQNPENDGHSRRVVSHDHVPEEERRGRSRRRRSREGLEGADARAHHRSRRHGQRTVPGGPAADDTQRGRSRRRLSERETSRTALSDRAVNGRRRERRRST
ncbi:hypothetical protein BR93DRAFT_924622, partial [Coniochaeta sp. PMI_546]